VRCACVKTTKVSFTVTNMDTVDYSKFQSRYTTYKSPFVKAVERGLEGLEHVSTGACVGCYECGLEESAPCPECNGDGVFGCKGCGGDGVVDITYDNNPQLMDLANEPHFSRVACDCCGSHLGGDRHPAHGIAKINDRETLVHLDVCTDCLVYLANGDEPEEWRP